MFQNVCVKRFDEMLRVNVFYVSAVNANKAMDLLKSRIKIDGK